MSNFCSRQPEMKEAHTLLIAGLHLQQADKNSALVIARRQEWLEGPYDVRRRLWPSMVTYKVPHVERYALGTRYTTIVQSIAELFAQLPEKPQLLVDMTATGTAPLEVMRDLDLGPVAITITDTGRPQVSHRVLSIPRHDLVTTLSLVLGEKRITVGKQSPAAPTLVT